MTENEFVSYCMTVSGYEFNYGGHHIRAHFQVEWNSIVLTSSLFGIERSIRFSLDNHRHPFQVHLRMAVNILVNEIVQRNSIRLHMINSGRYGSDISS